MSAILRGVCSFLAFSALLSACSAPEEQQSEEERSATAIAAYVLTQTAGPTHIPSITPSPSSTSTSTPIATNTATPTPAPTSTPEPTATPSYTMGDVRENPETGQQEVWVGQEYVEAPANFDRQYLEQGEDGVVRYRAPGVMLNYDTEVSDWRIPPVEEIPFTPGETTEIWMSGGESKVNQEAMEIYRQKFLEAWINTYKNDKWRTEMFGGPPKVSWAQIETYLAEHDNKLPISENGPEVPYYISNFSFVGLKQYLRKYNISEVDVSSDASIMVNWVDWEKDTHGVRSFVDGELDGQKNLFTGRERAWGFKVTPDGHLVWMTGGRNAPIVKRRQEITVGGADGVYEPGRDIRVATAQFLSSIKIMDAWHPDTWDMSNGYPLDGDSGRRKYTYPYFYVVDTQAEMDEVLSTHYGGNMLVEDVQ